MVVRHLIRLHCLFATIHNLSTKALTPHDLTLLDTLVGVHHYKVALFVCFIRWYTRRTIIRLHCLLASYVGTCMYTRRTIVRLHCLFASYVGIRTRCTVIRLHCLFATYVGIQGVPL